MIVPESSHDRVCSEKSSCKAQPSVSYIYIYIYIYICIYTPNVGPIISAMKGHIIQDILDDFTYDMMYTAIAVAIECT